jgi:hypothetical protein
MAIPYTCLVRRIMMVEGCALLAASRGFKWLVAVIVPSERQFKKTELDGLLPNVLRFSCAASIEWNDYPAEICFQNPHDLARRVAASTASACWATRFGTGSRCAYHRAWRDGVPTRSACAMALCTRVSLTRRHPDWMGICDGVAHTSEHGAIAWRLDGHAR